MVANPFDEFDKAEVSNPFDEFDAPEQRAGIVPDVVKSFASGAAQSIPETLTLGGAALAYPVERVVSAARGREPATFGQLLETSQTNPLAKFSKAVDYEPQTKEGRYAKAAGYGAGIAPLGGGLGLTRAVISGTAGGIASEAGGDVAAEVFGEDARIYGNLVGGIGGGLAADRYLGAPVQMAVRETANASREAVPSASEIMAAAGEKYAQARKVGGSLSSRATNAFLEKAIPNLKRQTSAGAIVSGQDEASVLGDRLSKLFNKKLNLDEVQEIDEALGELASKAFKNSSNKEASRILQAQTSLREVVNDLSPNDVGGGVEGFEALVEGRRLFREGSIARDVENIISTAKMTDNPSTSIKTQFRAIAKNPKRLRMYPKDVQSAIKEAAQTGLATDVLRVAGSRLVPIIATGAGIPSGGFVAPAVAGLTAYGAGEVARKGATALQVRKAEDVVRAAIGQPRLSLTERMRRVLQQSGKNIGSQIMKDFPDQRGAIGLGNIDEAYEEGLRIAKDLELDDLAMFRKRDTLTLHNLVVPKSKQKKGIGTKAMQRISDYADKNGLKIVLTTGVKDDLKGTTSSSRLKKFYKKFGFVENKGRNKDFSINGNMYREPN